MKRVTGIGGIFFKSKDPQSIQQWYAKHLGFKIMEFGAAVFSWKRMGADDKSGYTVWSPFEQNTKYFDPSLKEFMVNFRVENLKALLEELKKEGVHVIDKTEEYEYGKFGWIVDPEGNKIELWEPVDEEFTKMYPQDHTIY